MTLHELLNYNLSLIKQEKNFGTIMTHPKSWFNEDEILYINKENINTFHAILSEIYASNKKIQSKFTKQKIFKFIEDELIKKKKSNNIFSEQDSELFFNFFEQQQPYKRYIVAPISGIRLDNVEKINISIFEIGKTSQLKSILSNDPNGYYIAVQVDNIYDDSIGIEDAKNKFLDFIRLIVFLYGKNDNKILIKTGLPSYPSVSHEQMYVETSSYHITENIKDNFPSSQMSSTYLEKIPVDNPFFHKNENFIKLWEIYEKTHTSKKVSKMEARLLNASIAIGESALSNNVKNSIIYTSMAFEILFSFDEGSLFQKSIGDRLADTFAFIVAKDKEFRMKTIKSVKEFYRLRSALVHGGDTKTNSEYITFNILLSAAIKELLNNEKYKNVQKVDDLYKMVSEAQNSY